MAACPPAATAMVITWPGVTWQAALADHGQSSGERLRCADSAGPEDYLPAVAGPVVACDLDGLGDVRERQPGGDRDDLDNAFPMWPWARAPQTCPSETCFQGSDRSLQSRPGWLP